VCEPVTIIAGIGLLIGAYSASQQIKATKEAAKIQQEQIDDQASAATFDVMQESRLLRSQARASAAESGLGGNTIDNMFNDIAFQGGFDASRIESNRQNGIAASMAEANGRIQGAQAQGATQFLDSSMSIANHYQTKTVK